MCYGRYSSPDLQAWTLNTSSIFPQMTSGPWNSTHTLHAYAEPVVLYNQKYDHYVLWFGSGFPGTNVSKWSAVSNSPIGPFLMVDDPVGAKVVPGQYPGSQMDVSEFLQFYSILTPIDSKFTQVCSTFSSIVSSGWTRDPLYRSMRRGCTTTLLVSTSNTRSGRLSPSSLMTFSTLRSRRCRSTGLSCVFSPLHVFPVVFSFIYG